MANPSPDSEDKWVFTLNLPFENEKEIEIVTTHHQQPAQDKSGSSNTIHSSKDDSSSTTTTNTSSDKISERKSLLQDDAKDPLLSLEDSTCWKYTSPAGLLLQSSILLKLSYRPAWQSIPEYTTTKRRRDCMNCLTSCCRRRNSTVEMEEEEQVWEIYTKDQIVKTERRSIAIRGMGPCQAIQVFLRPLLDEDEDDDSQDRMSPPKEYQASLNVHRQRRGKPGQDGNNEEDEEKEPWSRFKEATDSAPKDSKYIVLTFAVPMNMEFSEFDPPLLWKVDLPRFQATDICLDTLTVLDGSIQLSEPPTHVFVQGYQSWSYSGSIWKGEKQPKPALPNVFSKAFNLGGTPCARPTMILPPHQDMSKIPSMYEEANNKLYQSDFFAGITTGRGYIMDEFGGPAFVCGWLSQHEQVGIVTIDETLQKIQMHASHRAHLVAPITSTDWAYAQLVTPHHFDEEPLVHFLHAAAAYNEARPLQNGPLLTGWCSWYHYYENISEANLRENFIVLENMKRRVPTNVAVVDDGYMTAWGDWDTLKPNKFTDMNIVSNDILNHGMRPGLWLAPFACDKHSSIVTNHPEWIIRNDRGIPANSANCGKFFYGLDATNPNVRKHVFNSIRRAVQDWGFQVLKIDFLYAACLEGNGKYDLSISRAQAMHLALQTIREAAGPDVFLIGCGCPIGVGIGYVDGMRVSADTGPTWYPTFPLPWWDHGTLPSLKAMIRNSMTRASFGHRWWHNDPDCLLLGKTTSLTNDEVATACSIVAMTCGMMLLSDDLTKVPQDRMRMLTKIFPMIGATGVVLDLHSTHDKGVPSILRLWCTDRYNSHHEYRRSSAHQRSVENMDHNAEATHFGRQASFNWELPTPHPNDRKRSCIHVAKGLGTWTIISLSNLTDKPRTMHIPKVAIEWSPADETESMDTPDNATHGWHLFSFWSGKYSWIPASSSSAPDLGTAGPLSRHLEKHQTEIFHIKPVTPSSPQYIGSDFHFSCGHEVHSFDALTEENKIALALKTQLKRVGHVFLFVPTMDTSHVKATVAGLQARWSVVGSTPMEDGPSNGCGRVLRIMVVIHGDGSDKDGEIVVEY